MNRRAFLLGLFVSSLSFSVERHGLEDFVKMALEQGDALKIQEAQLKFAEAREDWAQSKRWFEGSLEALLGPAPAASGNAISSSTDWSNWGGFVATQIEIKQPVYTFGAIRSGIEAAKKGVEAEKLLLESEKWKIRSDIVELYYGYQLAFELSQLGEDIVKKLQQAKSQSRGDSRQELIMALADMESKTELAKKSKEQARLAMGWRTHSPVDENLFWDQSNLKKRAFQPLKLEAYKSLLQTHRPEWQALEAEYMAKKELSDVEEALSLPMVFLYAQGQYRWADHRKNSSTGPFSYDPSNLSSGVVGVGIKWDLDVSQKSAKRAQARAEYLKSGAKKSHYQRAMQVEMEKAYGDLEVREKSLKLYEEASEIATKRYQDALVAYGLKNLSGKKLLEKMAQYGKLRKDYLESLYHYNLATHKLEQTVGSRE